MLQILYGIPNRYSDVTRIALDRCVNQNQLTIPSGDCDRAKIFGDPVSGILKHIVVKTDKETIYDHTQTCVIDISSMDLDSIRQELANRRKLSGSDPYYTLSLIHSELNFVGGSLRDEYPEQIMAVSYIKPEAKVLELGSNIGRNTLIIATLLENQQNFVTMECDPDSFNVLLQNRQLNNYTFHADNSALSYQKLIQRGWDTIPSEVLLDGYKPVKTTTFEELEAKYNIQFDTMVVDCEGALFYILKDRPSILDNIKLIIMENDYHNIMHKNYIDDLMRTKGFLCVYTKAGGWGPCYNNFFEVWSK